MISAERYYELVQQCVEYDRAFHTEGISLIPDDVYDNIRKQILEFEEANPAERSANSPSQRVGEAGMKDQLTIQHGSRMMSLHPFHTVKAVTKKINEWYEMFGDDTVVIGEPKYDGNAGKVRYVDGLYEVAASRGDGEYGRDITDAMRYLVPEEIDCPGVIEISGEIVFISKMLDSFNKLRINAGMDPVANERSAVHAALYGMKDFNSFPIRRYLSFVAFDVVSDSIVFKTRSNDMSEFIKSNGLNPSSRFVCRHKDTVDTLVNVMIRDYSSRYTENNGLLLDGFVVKVDSLALALTLGATSTYPKWAYAYKFEPLGTIARVWKLDYTIGRTGAVTPMVHIDPIKLGGTQITKASLANESKLYRLDIRIGDKVRVYRGGDVIPQVGYVVERAATVGDKIEWPTNCPCCNSLLEVVGAKSYCRNDNCSDRIVAQLVHFFGKTGVDLPGISEGMFSKLVAEFGVKNALDVLRLPPQAISMSSSLGNSSKILLNKAIMAVLKDEGLLLRKFIYALGIPGVGAVTSSNLQFSLLTASSFLSLADPANLNHVKVANVSADTLLGISKWLEMNLDYVHELVKLLRPSYHMEPLKQFVNPSVKDKTFVLTGEMPELRETLVAGIQAMGGFTQGAVSKKTDALVLGDGGSPSKIKKAKKSKVPVITYDDLKALLADVR